MSQLSGPSLENEAERRRESFRSGYIPGADLVVDPSVVFHTDATEEIDPITYEVIRSKLWNLNLDHGDTIRLTSGSNIIVDGHDFNASVTTETGDGAVFGPYALFFAGYSDLVIKWTLEHRSHNPGIGEGDVFIQDDPWVGTNHQMDTAAFGPVFWEGRLFAWIYNCVHQREIGGPSPGGFARDADDVYKEPSFMPPIKLVEGDVLREDILDAWTRRSRMPDLIALEVKSQLAGIHFARRRMLEILDQYGAAVVKGVMHRTIEATSDIVGRRLAQVPDGIYRDERYVAGARYGDRNLYRLALHFDKQGDRLRVSNRGTDPSVGSLNHTAGVFRGSVVNALFPLLGYDTHLCGAGLLAQIDFDLAPGTISSAIHPAAVSSSLATMVVLNQAHYLGSKMLSGHPDLSRHGFGACAIHTLGASGLGGIDQYGGAYGDSPLDLVGGGSGAFPTHDGMDHGGAVAGASIPISDVEMTERVMPILYMYRRELPESGAHGRFRGGATLASAWVGHKTPQSAITTSGLLQSVTQGLGLDGALPASGGRVWHASGTGIQAALAEARMPAHPRELRALLPEGGAPPADVLHHGMGPDDVFEIVPNPGGGHGDPLLREAERLVEDVRAGRTTADEAGAIYGVAFDAKGEVDAAATEALRQRRRAARLDRARAPRVPCAGAPSDARDDRCVTASVRRAGTVLGCAHCGQPLSSIAENYRLGCAELEDALPLSELFEDPVQQTGQALVLRRYLCPGCGLALDSEICRPEDEPFRDLELATA